MVFMIKQGTKQMTQSNGNIISRIVLISAILFMMVTISGYADVGDIWVHPPEITVGPGPFTAEIHLDMGIQSMDTFQVEIVFDPAVIQLDGVEIPDTGWAWATNINEPGHVSVAAFNVAAGIAGGNDFHLLTVNFINSGAQCSNIDIIDSWIGTPRLDLTGISGVVNPQYCPAPLTGDANGDSIIDIVDALLTAQYYVGLDPQNFNPDAADVDCNGSIDIIDALLMAQYYVGIISSFC